MIYVVYRIIEGDPYKGYYWGKWKDPVKLAEACFNLANVCYDIKVVTVDKEGDIKPEIEW
jgi:hypothetical protein